MSDTETSRTADHDSPWKLELEHSTSVFALVVMAQIHAKRVKDGATRKGTKVALVRLL